MLYLESKNRLGQAFLDEVERVLNQIESFPEMFPLRDSGKQIRGAFVKRFRYIVFYQVKKSEILILDVIPPGEDWTQKF